MSVSITLPANPVDFVGIQDVDKLNAKLGNAKQRKIVFFDESVSVFVVLKHDDSPKTVFMDVSIVSGTNPSDAKSDAELLALPNETAVIASFPLAAENVILSGKSDLDGKLYSIWTYQVPIVYPKKKVNNPQILISCYCCDNVSASTAAGVETERTDILPDLVAESGSNLLSELNNSILRLENHKNYELLSSFMNPTRTSSSPTRVPEKKPTTQELFKTSVSLPVSISLVIRLKSTKPAGRNNVLLATLNVESSEELSSLLDDDAQSYYFSILSLDVSFESGSLVQLAASDHKIPMRIHLDDALNLTYKLINADLDRETQDASTPGSRALSIRLVLQVQQLDPISQSYVNVSNEITTLWAPILDFTIMAPPINSSLRTTVSHSLIQPPASGNFNGPPRKSALQNMYNMKSKSNSSQFVNNTNNSAITLQSAAKRTPFTSSNVTVNLANNPCSALSGLKLTFIGNLTLKLGEVNTWKIQAVNNSNNTLNLSIVVQDPLNLSSNAPLKGQSSNNSSSNILGPKHTNDVLVVGKMHLLNEITSMKHRTGGVVFLENDLRLGPMETNNVMETSIQLMGIARGIHNLEGIKVFDTNTGDGLDFGKLVQVFVT